MAAGLPMGLPKPARDAWARTRLRVWPEDYWIVSLPLESLEALCRFLAEGAGKGLDGQFAALVQDHREVTATLAGSAWARAQSDLAYREAFGPLKAISFDIPLEMELVGYMAPAAARLAAAGVSIIPQCAFSHDHLLVRADQLPAARAALEDLIAEAKAPH